MKEWLEQLRAQSQNLGQWRRRRNALPNIMVLRNINIGNEDSIDNCSENKGDNANDNKQQTQFHER